MGNSTSILSDYRSKLSKKGKALLDEYIQNCASLSEDQQREAITLKVEQLLTLYPLPPIRLIKIDDFVRLGTFPRCPENENLCHNLDTIDRDNSLLIFISHCWLRGYPGAVDWNGRPHPDNAADDKFKLCVEGLDKIKRLMAPKMKDCYVWLDFGCMNQDGNPAGELEQLDKLVECCDAIFTPVVDPDHESWTAPQEIFDWLLDYQAKLWNDGPYAYLNRGWCRIEMLYAANIPILENTNPTVKRHTMFESALAFHCSQNRRPHFVYGHKEQHTGVAPLTLPPLQHTYFTDYHPLDGNLSVTSDREHIAALVAELQPYIDAHKAHSGYEGDVNAQGLKHGKGTLHLNNGDVYVGDFQNNEKHGTGVYRCSNGDVYDGQWVNGRQCGQGTFTYANGTRYEGQWEDNLMQGQGKFWFAEGNVYEGAWVQSTIHGLGVCRFVNGDVYEGEYVNGEKSGRGMFRYADGDFYDGEWLHDMQHGFGKLQMNGAIYEGQWNNDVRQGQGALRYANGDVYEGDFFNNKMHGYGVYTYASGQVVEGDWEQGQLAKKKRDNDSSSACVVC